MERVSLNKNALQIQFAKELPEYRPLMVFAGGVAGLADRHAQSSGVERDLGNERGTAAGSGLDRASQGLAVADQLIEIGCATRDLGDRPVPDSGAECSHIQLAKEVAATWP